MSGPPTDISASELWLKLASAERPYQIVDFPRRDQESAEAVGQVAIRILTQEEQMSANLEAEKLARKHLKDGKKDEFGYERLYSDSVCVEVLFRACRDPKDLKRPAFPSPADIRRALTTEECGRLFEHYLTVQIELGPTVASMNEEECEAWIERLVEGGSAYPLDSVPGDKLRILFMYMAYQLASLRTVNTSVGPQLEDGTSVTPQIGDDDTL